MLGNLSRKKESIPKEEEEAARFHPRLAKYCTKNTCPSPCVLFHHDSLLHGAKQTKNLGGKTGVEI